MKTIDFDYELPQEFIAQVPTEPRDHSKLLILERSTGLIQHQHFFDLDRFVSPGDLLIVNRTRVIPARIYAKKKTGGKVEILLLHKESGSTWKALVGGKGLRIGTRLQVDDLIELEVTADLGGSQRTIEFSQPIEPFLSQIGHMPLPPYIHTDINDPERYQTVYAREPGSAAAPTAGLHFTRELMGRLTEQGIHLAEILLHVGLDTFAPVTEDNPEEHRIHSEWCEVQLETCQKINLVRRTGGRVIAVGTTSVRTLEAAAINSRINKKTDPLTPFSGNTELFIHPGYDFRLVDAMITNFHLPKSTLIMLVSAFAGRERILNTYELAKTQNYRFYSFGDAMLIL